MKNSTNHSVIKKGSSQQLGWSFHQFPKTDVTNYHERGDFTKRKSILAVLEARSPIQGVPGLVPTGDSEGEPSRPVSQLLAAARDS